MKITIQIERDEPVVQARGFDAPAAEPQRSAEEWVSLIGEIVGVAGPIIGGFLKRRKKDAA